MNENCGTKGSNPFPSSKESANFRSPSGGRIGVRTSPTALPVSFQQRPALSDLQALQGHQLRIILDLDATDDPLHGHQEGRFFRADLERVGSLALRGRVQWVRTTRLTLTQLRRFDPPFQDFDLASH